MSERPAAKRYHVAPWSCIAERITRALGDWTQLIGAPTRVLDF
jgi:hypothetical protein